MRILHIENTSGVPYMLSRWQRELGHEADVVETWRKPGSHVVFLHDFENYYDGSKLSIPGKMLRTVRMAKDYDIIHVHAGMPRKRLDFPLIRYWRGKPIVAHYHGSECRMGYGMAYQSIARAKIVATPDLLKYHPDAQFIPNPMPEMPYSWDEDAKPRIVHTPTRRYLKGTDLVLVAIKELRGRGVDFDFDLIENVPRHEWEERMAKAHIVIDQVNNGASGVPGLIGMVSLEAMAMGKVAVAHVADDMLPYYPGLPVENVQHNIIDLTDKLEGLVSDMEATRKRGLAGPGYVRDHHSPSEIAKRHLAIYNQILNRGGM